MSFNEALLQLLVDAPHRKKSPQTPQCKLTQRIHQNKQQTWRHFSTTNQYARNVETSSKICLWCRQPAGRIPQQEGRTAHVPRTLPIQQSFQETGFKGFQGTPVAKRTENPVVWQEVFASWVSWVSWPICSYGEHSALAPAAKRWLFEGLILTRLQMCWCRLALSKIRENNVWFCAIMFENVSYVSMLVPKKIRKISVGCMV